MQHSAELQRCLEACDVEGVRKLSAHVWPHLPQPQSDADALVAIHHARTQAPSIAFKHRAYSHAWLNERGYPSGLPDDLKPKVERIYPRIVGVVGISTRSRTELALAVSHAMSDAVMDAFEDGKTDPVFVKGRMLEARRKILKQ